MKRKSSYRKWNRYVKRSAAITRNGETLLAKIRRGKKKITPKQWARIKELDNESVRLLFQISEELAKLIK